MPKRKRKLDPKIIRVDDYVRIDNPEMFVRCGYPLSLNDMCKEVEDIFGKVIEDLIYSVRNLDKFMQRDENGKYVDDYIGLDLNPVDRANSGYGEIYLED